MSSYPASAHLQVTNSGMVLVASEQADELIQVDPDEGVIDNLTVARYPHNTEAGLRPTATSSMTERFGDSAAVLHNDKIIQRFNDLTQPGGVIVNSDIAVIINIEAFSITGYDLSVPKRVTRLDAGKGPTHLVMAGDNAVAVTDTRGDRIHFYSVDPLELTDELALKGRPYGIAADAESETVWITLTKRNQVVGLDISGDKPIELARFPTVRQPNTIAVSPGADTLWVTGTSGGEVQRIER